MLHMKNIRELKFTASFVDKKHWNAIATLGSLEELSFDSCTFLQGPADVEPGTRVTVKVSRLRVVECDGLRQLMAIDAPNLRTLAMDSQLFNHIDWLSRSALTELHVTFQQTYALTLDWYTENLHTILMKAPQSLETLSLFVGDPFRLAQDVARHTFDDPAWNSLPLLRSLTLCVCFMYGDTPTDVRQLSSLSVSHGS
jgi:hypothetical protein